jgi:hypothetical protein
MSVDVGDIFAKSTCALRSIQFNFNNNLARSDVKAACETKERGHLGFATTWFGD